MPAQLTPAIRQLVELAIAEDCANGDVTSEAIFEEPSAVRAAIIARERLVISGLDVAAAVFERFGASMSPRSSSGWLEPGTTVADVEGDVRAVLGAERTALNFLQRLSGVATSAKRFAEAVAGTEARVVDTRKTTPGYRLLEKRAVADGGLHNHRADLSSGVLIKDNHIAAAGGVAEALARARSRAPHGLRIEIEVDSRAQLDEAIAVGVDIVLLDNMTPEMVAECAAAARRAGVLVEVSGGITLDTVREYALAGADVISVGALTHSAPAVDLALDF